MAISAARAGSTRRRVALGAVLLLWLWALPISHAQQLVFGEMVVHSSPGQPLRASVPLRLPANMPLTALRLESASEEDYRQQGKRRPPLLDTLSIALLARGDGRASAQLQSEHPWRGEQLVLLLHSHYGEQREILSLTLHPVAPASQEEYIQVGDNDSLDAVALRLAARHNRSYMHMMYALYRANPEAFTRNNMNLLRGGTRLRIPSTEELYSFDDAEAFGAIRTHQEALQQPASSSQPDRGTPLTLTHDQQELLNELQTLSADETAVAEQNRAMREKLAQLESRVSRFGAELLADPEPTPQVAPEAPPLEAATPGSAEPESPVAHKADAAPEPPAGSYPLPAWLFLLLMLLVLGSGFAIARLLPPPQPVQP